MSAHGVEGKYLAQEGSHESPRRFPASWRVEQIPGGYKVLDANGQALAYVYARETKAEADIAKALTFDEARRIAVNVVKLPELMEPTRRDDARG